MGMIIGMAIVNEIAKTKKKKKRSKDSFIF